MPCPIWPEHPAETQRLYGEHGTLKTVNRYRCATCGEFEVSWIAAETIKTREQSERWALSWATRNASERGTILRLVEADVRRTVDSVSEPATPLAKIDILVHLLGSRTRALGEAGVFDPAIDWPLLFARGNAEAERLLVGLRDLRLAEVSSQNDAAAKRVVLSLRGWERVGALAREVRPTSTKAFVAMWFHESMALVYNEGFYPALYGLGYDPIRVDREEYLGKVDDFIIARIRRALYSWLTSPDTAAESTTRQASPWAWGFLWSSHVERTRSIRRTSTRVSTITSHGRPRPT